MFARSVLSSYYRLLAGVALALVAIALTGCNEKVVEKAVPSRPVLVATVHYEPESPERSFVGTLERNGIKREDPVGQPFDPNLHQAMAEQDSELHAPGTVLQAWSKAWTLNGRLLRPAMVVVAKAPAAELTGPGQR